MLRNSDAGDEEPERQRDPRAKRNDGREADAAKVPICPIHALILINGEKGGCDYPCVMDVRFEVLRIHNVWTLTHSGPEVKSFESQSGAITAGIAEACHHHERDGGHATVHLWEGGKETVIFETVKDDPRARH